MWPFQKKHSSRATSQNDEGALTFKLTAEEEHAINRFLAMGKGYEINPKYAEEFKNGSFAFALSNYAQGEATMAEAYSDKRREESLKKAISAMMKAYSFYQLPIYLYDFACLAEKEGKLDMAKQYFEKFLNEQENYKPGKLDNLYLRTRDVNQAISEAKRKLKEI
jgi:tetratricopeptide (TPR) repeat protein